MKSSSNLNISCKVVFSSNKWNEKVGSPSSFRRKQQFISLNSSASIENLSSSERVLVRALITQKMMRRKDAQCNIEWNHLNKHVEVKHVYSKHVSGLM